MSDHDPFNEPETAHPRARELMKEAIFWDPTDEGAPFGSDEGFDAYYEWRTWREKNPNASLKKCFAWILQNREDEYNESLCTPEQVEADLEEPEGAFLADHYDILTLDATIIATGLGQLLDEGKIDADCKPILLVAINRQSFPGAGQFEAETINAIQRVVIDA